MEQHARLFHRPTSRRRSAPREDRPSSWRSRHRIVNHDSLGPISAISRSPLDADAVKRILRFSLKIVLTGCSSHVKCALIAGAPC